MYSCSSQILGGFFATEIQVFFFQLLKGADVSATGTVSFDGEVIRKSSSVLVCAPLSCLVSYLFLFFQLIFINFLFFSPLLKH